MNWYEKAQNRPIKAYHGTATKSEDLPFTEFDPDVTDSRFEHLMEEKDQKTGIYFTPRYDEAAKYAQGKAIEMKGNPLVITANIYISNPFITAAKMGSYMNKSEQADLHSKGYDGAIILEREGDDDIYQIIAFSPEQIEIINHELV